MDQNLKDFYFFSEFLSRKVYDASGHRFGKISDLVAERTEPYPMIIGIMVGKGRKKIYLPWEKLAQIEPQLILSDHGVLHQGFPLPEKDIMLLREEVMDKQIVDTFGAKVVRVNDLHFLRVDSHLRLVHVDVGFRGLMRRVGWEKCAPARRPDRRIPTKPGLAICERCPRTRGAHLPPPESPPVRVCHPPKG